MNKNKTLTHLSFLINLIAILFVLYYSFFLKNDPDFFGVIMMGIIFISIVYAIAFIHSFWNLKLLKKLFTISIDSLPVVILIFVQNIGNMQKNTITLSEFVNLIVILYILPIIVIVLLSFIIHKILIKTQVIERKN